MSIVLNALRQSELERLQGLEPAVAIFPKATPPAQKRPILYWVIGAGLLINAVAIGTIAWSQSGEDQGATAVVDYTVPAVPAPQDRVSLADEQSPEPTMDLADRRLQIGTGVSGAGQTTDVKLSEAAPEKTNATESGVGERSMEDVQAAAKVPDPITERQTRTTSTQNMTRETSLEPGATGTPAFERAKAPGPSPSVQADDMAEPLARPQSSEISDSPINRIPDSAPASVPDVPAERLGAVKSPATVKSDVPRLRQLPRAIAEAIPKVRIYVHVFDPKVELRFVVTNMGKFVAGEEMSEDLLLEDITPQGLIMAFKGTRFRLDSN